MTHRDFLFRLLLALLLGAVIGLERQWHQRMAGLRTNVLVSVGSALFVSLGFRLVGSNIDPTRMASYVVSGIGFLGAGVIMREGLHVKGLNTAATLWCAAAVGVLSGAGFFFEASVGAATVVLAHLVLRPVARAFASHPMSEDAVGTTYRIRVQCRPQDEQRIRALMLQTTGKDGFGLKSLHSEDAERPERLDVAAVVVSPGRTDRLLEEVVSRLSLDPSVSAVSWEIVAFDLDEA